MSKLRTLRMRGEGQTITINKKIILLSHLKAETCFLDKHRSGDFDYISISALLSFAHSHALGEITTKRYQKANLDKDESSPEFIFPCFCLRSGGQSKPFASTTSLQRYVSLRQRHAVLSFSISMAAALVWTYWDLFLASSRCSSKSL